MIPARHKEFLGRIRQAYPEYRIRNGNKFCAFLRGELVHYEHPIDFYKRWKLKGFDFKRFNSWASALLHEIGHLETAKGWLSLTTEERAWSWAYQNAAKHDVVIDPEISKLVKRFYPLVEV